MRLDNGLKASVRIQNPKYYRHFDNTDNPDCWQLDRIGDDIEQILGENGISYESMYEDWGASFGWVNAAGVAHSLSVRCVDVDKAAYEISAFAFRRRWLFSFRQIPVADTDFDVVLPALLQLDIPR